MSSLIFEYPVSVSHLSFDLRYSAACWAIDQFGQDHVNIFVTNQEGTFLFERSEDAMFFALKWIR